MDKKRWWWLFLSDWRITRNKFFFCFSFYLRERERESEWYNDDDDTGKQWADHLSLGQSNSKSTTAQHSRENERVKTRNSTADKPTKDLIDYSWQRSRLPPQYTRNPRMFSCCSSTAVESFNQVSKMVVVRCVKSWSWEPSSSPPSSSLFSRSARLLSAAVKCQTS